MGNKLNEKTLWNILLTLSLISILINFLSLKIKNGSIVLLGALWLILFLFYLIFKSIFNDKAKTLGYRIVFFSGLLTMIGMVNLQLFKIPSDIKGVGIIFMFLNVLVILGVWSITKIDAYAEIKESFIEFDLLSKLNFNNNEKENAGDIKICVNKVKDKDEILPEEDRFLHMLILGATGSGKTSQIIIPMLNQDMQNKECGITVIEPKGDLAEYSHQMAKHHGKDSLYFNPTLPDCPYFNPLQGKEEDVIENMATTFKMLNPDSPQFFQDMNEQLIRNSLLVLKRLMGEKATLIELARLIQNSGGVGRKIVMQFSKIKASTEAEAKENTDVASWFLNDYFNERSKTYEHCSGLRSQVAKITSNKHLRRVLNPPNGISDIDFVKHLKSNSALNICTAQGKLRDLGRFLGYFIILNLQSAVFKRPGNEETRMAHFLYIDEFQSYANPGFGDMLTQGRSYRVASHLATQNRALMAMGGGRDGKNFVELVSTNARNIIIYPGANIDDAKYYSEQFGEEMNLIKQKGMTKQKFNPLYGLQQLNYPSEQERVTEQMEARFSPTDIIYRPFGELTYCIIKDKTVQTPAVGKVSFIDSELHKHLKSMVTQYNEEQKEKREQMLNGEKNHSEAKTTIDDVEEEKEEVTFLTKDDVEGEEDEGLLFDDSNDNDDMLSIGADDLENMDDVL